MRKTFLAVMVTAAMAAVGNARAQSYASGIITMISPFPAGGPLDRIGRIVAEPMRVSLGQPVIVENVTGAHGSIGTARVARAAPDGYTIGLGYWGTHVANGAIYQLQYDIVKDFEPIALLATSAPVLVAKNAMPANDLGGLVAWLKANPDRASQGTAGVGSAAHVAGLLFQKETSTRYQFVHYRGVAPGIQDIVAGNIDMMFVSSDVSLPLARAGRIKLYATAAKSRMAAAPEIPTVSEAGLPGFEVSLWWGLWAPKGTPRSIVAKLNEAVVSALADPAIRQKLADQGLDVPARERQTPEALGAFQKAEIEKWWPILKAANVKPE